MRSVSRKLGFDMKAIRKIKNMFFRVANFFLRPLLTNLVSSQNIELLKQRNKFEYELDCLKIRLNILNRIYEEYNKGELVDYLHFNLMESKSQILQDLIVGFIYRDEPGFFVEFGAADGINLSNTFFLEKKLNWTGVLCEPSPTLFQKLRENRSAILVNKCVWSDSNYFLDFLETENLLLSTISSFSKSDSHSQNRKKFVTHKIESICLNDLLISTKAPKTINFMSIDTEGSEYSILENFDFSNWNIECIFVEHNFTSQAKTIRHLLETQGFQLILEDFSEHDYWFVKPEIACKFD
jgi:FkbM family methyltransferase